MQKGGMTLRQILLPLLKLFLWLHSFSYRMSGFLAVKLEGIHPKHRIMNYHEFFVNNIGENDVVLDVGCGNGALTYDIAKKAKKVVGIDVNEKNIDFARKNFSRENITYICGDAMKLLPEEEFDVIVLSNVLEHIENRVEFLKTLKKRGKKFLIRVPMINRSWIDVYKKELGMEYRLDKTHYIEYTFESFKDELEKAGLKIVKHSVQFGEIWAVAVGEDE
jgi:SAM-dependent methyltransferase